MEVFMMENIKGIIFDIDGVLEYQGKVYPGAIEVVNSLREKGMILRFLTNSTLKSRASCAAKLNAAGFEASDEEVFTASYATAMYLRSLNPHSVWVMVDREGMDEFRDFLQDEENPEYVVVGDSRSRFDFDHLNQALRMLKRGARLIGMQPELIDSSLGGLELNVGSWVGMLERAAGIEAIYIGKPSRFAFELPLTTMRLDRSQVLVVGDRVATDIKGAKALGMKCVLIQTGEYRDEELDVSMEPDYKLDSIQQILALFPH
jgi:HAD superfamily hydrolase (TIGR01458 family)